MVIDVVDSRTFKPVRVEGVVVEIVPSGQVAPRATAVPSRKRLAVDKPRFVIQCRIGRVTRTAAELTIVAP